MNFPAYRRTKPLWIVESDICGISNVIGVFDQEDLCYDAVLNYLKRHGFSHWSTYTHHLGTVYWVSSDEETRGDMIRYKRMNLNEMTA